MNGIYFQPIQQALDDARSRARAMAQTADLLEELPELPAHFHIYAGSIFARCASQADMAASVRVLQGLGWRIHRSGCFEGTESYVVRMKNGGETEIDVELPLLAALDVEALHGQLETAGARN